MLILGISAYHHGASAALLRDGLPVAAAQEQHFTRERDDSGFPTRAIRHCLRAVGAESPDLDHVIFHERPLRRFERTLVHQLKAFPRSRGSFAQGMFHWLGERLWVRGRIADELGLDAERVAFCEHAMAHAAWSFFSAPAHEAALLVADDEGEWTTTLLASGAGTSLRALSELRFPHSLGLLAASVAEFLGFEPGRGGERALMELAAHGQPRFAERFAQILQVAEDGSFSVDTTGFRFSHDARRRFGPQLEEWFGPPRLTNGTLRLAGADTRDADLAASCQLAIEGALLALARRLRQRASADTLCFSGEVARNSQAVARLLRDGPFESVWVPPAPGDAGLALGAALRLHHELDGNAPRNTELLADPQLGEDLLLSDDAACAELPDHEQVLDALLERLLRGELVGWVRGGAALGGRSLGQRCALMDPRDAAAARRQLASLKAREDFRPFHPVLLAEAADEALELPVGGRHAARFGRIAAQATPRFAEQAPAVVHVDGSTRALLVDAQRDALMHQLLQRFADRTGVPALLHTTLNGRGAPAVRTEAEALDLMQRSAMTALVVERRLHTKA
ncbi:MAG: hypothetical protein DHS20C15_34450 [Planctomycetota bacterium]|nr:MAG: hypothetical protein DHS20C15_34450 [Planctomycetota bacterium]